jgi:NitT/TauT family transport system substrate-binding protein
VNRILCVALSVLAVSVMMFAVPYAANGAKDPATLGLDWLPIGNHVGIFAAQDKGFYARENLDLNIKRGFGSSDTVKRIGAGESDFGHADIASAVVGRSRGLPVKSVGVVFSSGFNALYALKSSGVRTPKDLEGKTFGDTAGGSTRTLLPAFLQANGIKNMPWLSMKGSAKNSSLISGKVDTIGTGISTAGILRDKARKNGDDIVVFFFSDYGVDIYAHGFLIRDDLAQSKPDLIRRFVKATFEGIAWAVEHPSEAVASYRKRQPMQTLRGVRSQWDGTVRSLLSAYAVKHGIGHINEKKMAYTIDTMTRLMKLPRRVSPSEMYTNRFLPKLFPKAGK